jgi:imidazolonepropionase-like amidohydrolase
MSNHDVLRTATILGAEGIGMSGDLGSLEGGKLADLVVLDKNPLDDIKNTNTIRYVMKNGRLYDGNTLDEVYPNKHALQHFVWQDGAPGAVTGTP